MAFIAFEGLDGSGKSTLIQRLVEELKVQSISYVLTREPGGTPLAEEIRKVILKGGDEVPCARTEVLLYEASRAQHVAQVIAPAIKKNTWVLCDRFIASTVAFQCFARNLKRADIDWLNGFAIDAHLPDLNILLDLSVEESNNRLQRRLAETNEVRDRMESENSEFHDRVRQGYLAQAKENPAQWLVLDATKSPSMLFSELLTHLKAKKWLEY